MSLQISHFKIKYAAFEARHRDSGYLFDRTGMIFEEARKLWPTIKLGDAEPRATAFSLDDRFSLQVQIDRTIIQGTKLKQSLEEFFDVSHQFEEIVRKTLEYDEYKRLGFKPIYFKEYKTKEEATKDIISSLGLKVPEGKHFNIQGQVPLITLEQRWEDDDFGITGSLRSEENRLEFTPPFNAIELESQKLTKKGIKYSPDYYTKKPVSVNKLNVKNWLEDAFHLIKRDSKVFLEK